MKKQKAAAILTILICSLTWLSIVWANDSLFYSYRVKKGDTLWRLFGKNWAIIARLNKITPKLIMPGMTLLVPHDWKAIRDYTPLSNRLPNTERKFILIDLEKQVLGTYEFGELKFWCPISSGHPGKSETPKGKFRILWKHENHISNEYPAPNGGAPMKYGLMFSWKGHWIHAGILRGRPTSKGCVRLFEKDARKLFLWAERKTPIEIK